jgi:hypothetical protein
MVKACDSNCDIIRSIRKASILKLISYATGRLPIADTVQFLPEIMPLFMYIKKDSLKEWNLEMEMHNQILRRGGPMGHKINSKNFEFCSLDQFMLQMHASRLAEVFDAFTAFAARVIPLIQKNPEAQSWWLNEHLLIQRHHWTALACRVMTLLKACGFEDGEFQPRSTVSVDRWPNLETLHESALHASRIFGVFGTADDAWFVGQPITIVRSYPSLSAEQHPQQGSAKRQRTTSPSPTI